MQVSRWWTACYGQSCSANCGTNRPAQAIHTPQGVLTTPLTWTRDDGLQDTLPQLID
jgi:hypothetical protein